MKSLPYLFFCQMPAGSLTGYQTCVAAAYPAEITAAALPFWKFSPPLSDTEGFFCNNLW